jgi:acyl-CoA synthetase (NDP forming)/RimJ/RimL family protein N-acetyltransferase
MTTAYPPSWEADVLVSDGGTVHLRPILPSDAPALVEFHGALSVRTRYLRFFSAYPRIPERDLVRFTTVDHIDRVAFIVLLADKIIAVGRYERTPDTDEAEVAFVVADAHQGRGIGSVLLEHLAAAARERGIRRFTAVVLAENDAMLRVFRDAGYQPASHIEYGEVSLDFEIDETMLTESVMREREQYAEARSIRRLMYPRSVAIVGASANESKIGNAVLRALLDGGFNGSVFAVNRGTDEVDGLVSYPTVSAIPQPVDLVVLAVPAESVPGVVAECAAAGVHGLVVVSGGFGERGDDAERLTGLLAQRQIVTEARAHGMRVVGPNCLGIINTDPDVRLNASLAPLTPPAGRAGFFSQSGALGVAILGEATRRGLGVSTFVSAGNRADVSGNDLLQYWETDPGTDIALLYLESFGNPRKFARVARRMGRHKPIVAVKSGRRSVVAGLAETSVDVPDASVQALFESSGVIRVATLGDLFDVAVLLAAQPLPAGDRVAIVGNSTALAVLAAEACDAEGLSLADMVDLGVETTPEQFGAAIGAAVGDPDVDAVVAVFVPPLQRTSGDEYAAALRAASHNGATTVLSTFLGYDGVLTALAEPGPTTPMPGSVPAYPTPERAVRALAQAVRHAQWRNRPVGVVPPLGDANSVAGHEFVDAMLSVAPGGRVLLDFESATLLDYYGIDVVASRQVAGIAQAQAAAAEFAAPVALKVPGAARVHLVDGSAIAEAWASLELSENAEATVQVMAPRGVDVVLEVHADVSFGSLVSFGIGGVATELLGDRGYAVVPLTDLDAADLLMTPRAAPMLIGYGDAQPVNLDALAALTLKLSGMADDLPQVASCSLWAVAAPRGVYVLAAEISLAHPGVRSDAGPRRLRGL